MIYTHRDMPFRYHPYRIRRVLNEDRERNGEKLEVCIAGPWFGTASLSFDHFHSILIFSTPKHRFPPSFFLLFITILSSFFLGLCMIQFYEVAAILFNFVIEYLFCGLYILYNMERKWYLRFQFWFCLSIVGIHAPLTLSFLNYLLLALVYGGIMIYRRQSPKVSLLAPLWITQV